MVEMSKPDAAGRSDEVGPFRQAVMAAKANLLPAMFLWAVAGAIILAYYKHEPTQGVLDRLAELKTHWGYAFSAISTGIIGGLWPLVFQRVGRGCGLRGFHIESWWSLPFMAGFWAYRGVEIDALYRLQGLMFGTQPTAWVLIRKTAVDQCLYVTIWAIPTMVAAYLWKDCGYSLRRTVRTLGRGWYLRRCVPILLANWVVWIPAVVVIYSLPPGLQMPVMNINLCLFVLLVMFLTHDDREIEPAP